MSKKLISWQELGTPTQPGTYTVAGVGEVTVEQEDIEDARELGGNPLVELLDSTTLGHRVRQFSIGLFTPQADTPAASEEMTEILKPRLLEFLRKLADSRGSAIYGPQAGGEVNLRGFQEEVDALQDLEEKGILTIGMANRESRTGRSYIDRVKVELTREGKRILSASGGAEKLEGLLRPATSQAETPQGDRRTVFVVHGRNKTARKSLFDFLRAVGLNPLEWSQAVRLTGDATPYVGEILDAAFAEAQAVVVLMTPDDEAALREPYRGQDEPPYEMQLTPQARPNVLFEAGMAMGRKPKRTVLVEVGRLRPFSDVGGRLVVRLDNSVERRHDLVQRLEAAGCEVNTTGRDWYTAGDFSIPTAGPGSSPSRPTAEQHAPEVSLVAMLESETLFDSDEAQLYQLTIWLANTGSSRVEDFVVECEFPADFIEETSALEEPVRKTETHRLFRATEKTHPGAIHSGDRRRVMAIKYNVDYFKIRDLRTSPKMHEVVRVTVRSGNANPRITEKEMIELVRRD
jgi:predicted nucleotide-binding protein